MTLSPAIRLWLSERFGPAARFGEPLARHTSLGVGGPAEAWVAVPDEAGLSELVGRAAHGAAILRVLGRGTNLLAPDEELSGISATLGKGFTAIGVEREEGGRILVRAGAGASLTALCRFAAAQGIAGMNFAVGIPGSVGGAVWGNAGTHAGCVADRLESLTLLRPDEAARVIRREELSFGYRSLARDPALFGAPGSPAVITSALFALFRGRRDEIEAEAREMLARRKATQPQGVKSAGCFFRNPPGQSAGALIDRAGLKNFRIGGALVSPVHANFLVNAGNAAAGDFLRLMEHVKTTVADKFGVILTPEVTILVR